jgi:hypothetical protein
MICRDLDNPCGLQSTVLPSKSPRLGGRLSSLHSDGEDYDPGDDEDQIVRFNQFGFRSPRSTTEIIAATIPAPSRPRPSYSQHKQPTPCNTRQTLCWGNTVRKSYCGIVNYMMAFIFERKVFIQCAMNGFPD